MEAAMKRGLMKEMSLKSSPKLHFDEFWSSNPQNAASPSSDYIFADQLLNFSNEEDGLTEEEEAEGEEEKNNHSSVSAPLQLQKQHENDENSNHTSTNSSEDDFWSVSSRDFEDLEWLSHLVADSTQEEYSPPPACSFFYTEKPSNYQKETTHHHLQPLPKLGSNLKTPFPSKPRSKRAKISARVWSLTNSIVSPTLFPPPAKKPKKNTAAEDTGKIQPPRRCSHCGVQKTPQWRAGPLGAKTLCNACGVRFKSGRLFPEYRPACSPTFSSEFHSNHHRKVLEMRRRKEIEKPQSGPDPAP